MITETVNIRKLIPEEGNVLTDKKTQTARADVVYLAKGELKTNYIEIPEDTPLPEEETPLV